MPTYSHYSFDLWLTLVKSNPAFKEERTRYFYKRFNTRQKSFDDIKLVFRNVDVMCNAINERTGYNIDADEMYLMVISMINDYSVSFDEIDLRGLNKDMEELVFKYLPVVYSSHTIEVLDKIKNKEKTTINILSNTGFIKGSTLREIIHAIGIAPFFDFQLYSDEIGYSKPNKILFQKLITDAKSFRNDDLELTSIIHVGDNLNADIKGAESVGIDSLLINSNYKSILNILDLW